MKETKGDHATMAIVISMPCFLWGLMIWMGLMNQNIDLGRLNKFEGEVIERGTTTKSTTKTNSNVFYLKIHGLNQTLGIYRITGDYSDLLKQINPSDSITVYYKFQEPKEINIDLVQIEKGGQILVNASEFEQKESSLIYIGLAAIIFNVGYSIYYYRTKTR